MAHLRRPLGALDEAAAALAEGTELVDEENRQVELKRLRLRLFGVAGGETTQSFGPCWLASSDSVQYTASG
jgi:hypothetical protein